MASEVRIQVFILCTVEKYHAAIDIHAYAMIVMKKQQSSNFVDYAPIARCFAQVSMDKATRDRTKKFDISYMIVKEKLAFTKMCWMKVWGDFRSTIQK